MNKFYQNLVGDFLNLSNEFIFPDSEPLVINIQYE